jgi:hypothetical protein
MQAMSLGVSVTGDKSFIIIKDKSLSSFTLSIESLWKIDRESRLFYNPERRSCIMLIKQKENLIILLIRHGILSWAY